jgi:hypothetical protein
MYEFLCTREDFLFWIFVHPTRPRGVMSSLRFNMTSSHRLRLHVNRGLERHGYPWVSTDQGPRGPCQVDPTCQKPR